VASWIDYLRFVATNDSLFPSVLPLLTPNSLRTSTLQPIRELREAWQGLEDRLERPDPDRPGYVISGLKTLQELLGRHVSDVSTLHLAPARKQSALTQECQRAAERGWREHATRKDATRLTDAGGKEAGWVSAVPTRPEYRLASADWRDAICARLAIPHAFLLAGPGVCCCHDGFDRRAGSIAQGLPQRQYGTGRRRRRRRPDRVDPLGSHDQRCPHSFSLGRHDDVQAVGLKKLKQAGKAAKEATVHELRAGTTDRSQRKGDLVCDDLLSSGKSTILDVGITYPLIDTNVNNKSTEERGYAANKYGDKKNKDYNAIIRTKSLDYTYKSITFGTFGAFGSGTWDVIERACDPRTHPDATGDYDPWRRPAPKRDFILSLGFALQRANVRMLRGSSLRRRRNRAKDCFASGSRSQ
jgi:hypothetical protein